jgi:hypothetical protein
MRSATKGWTSDLRLHSPHQFRNARGSDRAYEALRDNPVHVIGLSYRAVHSRTVQRPHLQTSLTTALGPARWSRGFFKESVLQEDFPRLGMVLAPARLTGNFLNIWNDRR